MATPYSVQNAEFSNAAHLLARTELYPKIFGVPLENLSFEDTLLEQGKRGEVLDGEMAVDRIVNVTAISQEFRCPIRFTVQERFRGQEFTKYQDITLTEWNNKTNLPSELYKLEANIFLYGYGNTSSPDKPTAFLDAIAIDIPLALIGICNGSLPYSFRHNPRSDQSFICLTFIELWKYGAALYWMENPFHFQPSGT